MFDVSDDVGMAELLAILAIFGIGGYFAYKFLKSSTCILKVGTVPGITGATQAQVNADQTATQKLKQGGAIIWSCGNCFDYLQPGGVTVTEARTNFWDKVPFLNAIDKSIAPMKYSCVPLSCYDTTKAGVNTRMIGALTAGCGCAVVF